MFDDTNCISKLELKRINRMHILRLLRNNGPTSRVDIAQEVKITKAAVTIITSEMIEEGILYEKGELVSRTGKVARGRKKILLDIDDSYRLGVGLVIEGGRISLGACTLKGKPVERQSTPLPDGCSAGGALAIIREMYGDIAYKNDLKCGTAAGMGVCVSEEYFPLLGVTRDENGQVDYSALEKALREFSDLPMVFGSLADGVAMAEMDYLSGQELPPVNMAVLHCDQDLSCTVVIDREIYRGSLGRPASLARLAGKNASSDLGKAYNALMEPSIVAQLGQLFKDGHCPVLRAQSLEDEGEFVRLLQSSAIEPEDPAVEAALRQFQQHYQTVLGYLAAFFAPDRIVCFGSGGVRSALLAAMEQINSQYPQIQGGLVRQSALSDEHFYLGAAAMATREFFINKGGY